MTPPSYQSDPLIQYLSQILQEIAQGDTLIPRFQRPFVWKDEQRVELLRSIRSGIPIGSIMVWRTSNQTLKCHSRLGPHNIIGTPSQSFRTYLLDGLQRLSTLFGVFQPRTDVELPEPTDIEENVNWNIYFDLRDEDFVIWRNRRKPPPPHLLPLHILLDSVSLIRYQRTLLSEQEPENLIRVADQLSTSVRQYKIPVIPIVTENLDQATLTFQRVNSQGTIMNQVHMLNALTWTPEFDLVERLTQLKDEYLGELGWSRTEDSAVLSVTKSLLGMDVHESNVDAISKAIKEQPQILSKAIALLQMAAKFLKEHCSIVSPRLLPYNYQIILLAVAYESISPEGHTTFETEDFTGRLQRWFWTTTYAGIFQGISYSELRKAVREIRSLAQGENVLEPLDHIDPTPTRFDFRTARVKALALRMAELKPQDADGQPADAVSLLSEYGSDAMPQLILSGSDIDSADLRRPANRFISNPQQAGRLRDRLLTDDDHLFLQRHAISQAAHRALREHDLNAFVQERLKTLEQLDIQFARQIGILSPETAED